MDLKKFPHIHLRGKGRKGDTARLAGQLAPLEEQDKQAARKQSASAATTNIGARREDGAIVVDSNGTFPTGISDNRQEKTVFGIELVVLVILIFMMAFIAFIAWQISLMPVQ